MEIFGRSRRQLTLVYTLIMCVFLMTLVFLVHKVMNWSMFSEQERELADAAKNISETQAYYLMHPDAPTDVGRLVRGTNDRLFFYVFDGEKQLVDFVRASLKIETFVLDRMDAWQPGNEEIEVFDLPNEAGQITNVMMTSRTIEVGGMMRRVFVGKDVTALYSGLHKSTYALIFLSIIALIFATAIGYVMAGRAIVPLREAYDKQKQFAADASHELRTPLAVVLASSELLLADKSITDPFLREVLGDVKSEVMKMSKLVADLLMVARSDNNALKLTLKKIDLGELLEQNVRMMTPIAGKKKIRLSGDNFQKVSLTADEQKIKQLILILVDNAIKYTPEGGEVKVRFEKLEENRAIFSVADSGIGIAEEDREKIFDRFYRVDKARSREGGGNGLGLAIAAEILKLHDGKISVDSEPGEGTKFTVGLRTDLKKK